MILVRQVVGAGLCENRTDFETPLHEDSLFPFTSVEIASGNRRHVWISAIVKVDIDVVKACQENEVVSWISEEVEG